ncbi:MAG: sigma-54 dependent transcriptional regulator [Deltaproteobacteria bacterium]|jgi:two-component system nitrogen regulation response regulator NtrX|nr:sigma-54 dependent transcriptional regulator [Deltaproteobacteria bacterium]
MPDTILVVDDEKDIRLTIGGLLADEGYLVSQASNGAEALERLEESLPSLVILDLLMEGAEQGFEVLERVKIDYPQLPVVVISGHGNIETAVKAVKEGAYDFIEKPLSGDKMLLAVQRGLSFGRLAAENQILRSRTGKPGLVAGRSPAMTALMKTVEMVAPTPASVLISGENGVGKELVAHTIHKWSSRADRPMIELNCAAIPEDLVESELFGHEKGAFTGADRRREGRFDMANNSTLFLDEIADMSLKTQAKILRILQERKFERVGGTKTIMVDVRIIAASNKDLEKEIDEGRFRKDLYYRLNVVPLVVPPLRERREDIPELAEKFLSDCLTANNLGPKKLDPAFLKKLASKPWPGNVRELKNTIERLAIITPGPLIAQDPSDPSDPSEPAEGPGKTPEAAKGRDWVEPPENGYMSLPYREAKAEFERRYFLHHIQAHGRNITQTAEAVSLDRTSLHKKLKALGFKDWVEGNFEKSS